MQSMSPRGFALVGSQCRLALTTLAFCSAALAPELGAQATGKAPLPTIPRPPANEVRQNYDSTELRRVLSPVALYPDPLLAQLLTAATFSKQVSEAARWSNAHRELKGQELTDSLAAEHVTWDPSVQAMLAFPTVLQMMASDVPWTEEVGDAFKAQPDDVMDAVQALRTQAKEYGYLRSNDHVQVSESGPVEILPVSPTYIVVPYYDPYVVFYPPPPRFVVSTAIYFGYGVRLGTWFEPWGRGPGGFYWPSHRVAFGYPGWGRPWGYSSSFGRTVFYSPRYYDGRGRSYDRDDRWDRDGRWDRGGRVDRDDRWNRDDRGERDGRRGGERDGDRRGSQSGTLPGDRNRWERLTRDPSIRGPGEIDRGRNDNGRPGRDDIGRTGRNDVGQPNRDDIGRLRRDDYGRSGRGDYGRVDRTDNGRAGRGSASDGGSTRGSQREARGSSGPSRGGNSRPESRGAPGGSGRTRNR